jgi:molybdopterin-guanine dinucleotide biosynthesis protein A
MWTAAILAGGRARRLGGLDKSALRVGNESILTRQLRVLAAVTPNVMIVADKASRFHDVGVRVVTDRIPNAGALGGLYTALTEASTDRVIVIACDMPFLTAPFLTHLATAGINIDAAIPRTAAGRHVLCACYAAPVAARMKSCIEAGDLRVGNAIASLNIREIGPDELAAFDSEGRLLLNINTPDDYTLAQEAARSESRSA